MASLTLGTRGSDLALWQANHVADSLREAGHLVDVQIITTTGDRILDVPLAQIGDKALFTKELDVALLAGEIDLAVHSLKDLPTALPEGIHIAAMGERAAPGDAFVNHPDGPARLADLPEGAVVCTSSLRRRAQLLAWRPDLEIPPVRGNVDTRIAKLDASDWHGIVLAEAGLERLGLIDRMGERIDREIMLPAVSQGALGIVCRAADDETTKTLRDALHHEPTGYATMAERAFLRRLEGGCQVPIGAHATVDGDRITVEGCVASLDGSELLRDRASGAAREAEELGTQLAETLIEAGADRILEAVREQEETE